MLLTSLKVGIVTTMKKRAGETMSSAELIKLIEKDGWYLIRVTGSHHHFKHSTKKGLTTIPHPKKDLNVKTVKSILKQAGI